MKQSIIFSITCLCIVASGYSQNLVPYKDFKNNLWGYKDKAGKVVVESRYLYKPAPFKEGRAIVSKTGNIKNVVDEKGAEIVPDKYNAITEYNNGFAVVGIDFVDTVNRTYGNPSKYQLKGIIDRNGKEVVPALYKDMYGDFSNGWFVKAQNAAKQVFHYNTSGKTFDVPAGLILMPDRIDGKKFVAMKGGKYGIIDQQFKELLPFEYGRITPTENGMLIAGQNNLYGLLDSKLKWIVQPTYSNIHQFQNGYAVIVADEKMGAINAKGIVTTTPQFNSISRIDKTSSAIAMFKNKGTDRVGLTDLATGKIITAANYYFFPSDYDYGMIVFKRDNKKGIMDSTGKEIFYDAFDDFSPGFLENKAWVMKNKKYGFIDKTGTVIIPMQYDMVGGFKEGLASVKLDGKYGFINEKGVTVIPIIYKDVQGFYSGMSWVKDENGRTFYIDKTGKEIK